MSTSDESDDAIIVTIDNHIYDITDYVEEHPGNMYRGGHLDDHNGEDVTALFKVNHGDSKVIRDILTSARAGKHKSIKYVGKKVK
jgi:cytochrome b involved in lipid metabolism